jgi:hypothetical protein
MIRIPEWSMNPTDRGCIEIINAARNAVEQSLEVVNDGYMESIDALRAALIKHGYMKASEFIEPESTSQDAAKSLK